MTEQSITTTYSNWKHSVNYLIGMQLNQHLPNLSFNKISLIFIAEQLYHFISVSIEGSYFSKQTAIYPCNILSIKYIAYIW